MIPSLVLGTTLLAPAAPVPQDTVPTPTGPAPHVVYLKADPSGEVQLLGYMYRKQKFTRSIAAVENGQRVIKQVEDERVIHQSFQSRLGNMEGRFSTADGTELTAAEVERRVKNGSLVLISADGKPIEKGWLRAVRPDTVVIVSESLAGAVIQPNGTDLPGTAAPRLVLLTPDAEGKLPVAYNPTTPNNMYAEEQVFVQQGGGGVVIVRRGVAQRAVLVDGQVGPVPTSGEFTTRPLEEVKFEAYDLNGKTVSRAETLRRLKAGGLVLIAGDGRLPDAEYLKPFHGDLLVLVSSELAIPPGANMRPAGSKPLPVAPAGGVAPIPAAPIPVAPVQIQPAVLPARVVPAKPAVAPAGGLKVAPAPKPVAKK